MNIVKELRKKKGVQQKELAIAVGVSRPTVSDWEGNKKDPTGDRLKRLAAYFGVDELVVLGKGVVDLNDGFVATGKPQTDEIRLMILQKLGMPPKTPEARLLAKGVDAMPESQRKAIVNMMVSLCPDLFEKGTETDDA